MHSDEFHLHYPKTFCNFCKQTAKLWSRQGCGWLRSSFQVMFLVPQLHKRTVCTTTAATVSTAYASPQKRCESLLVRAPLTGFDYDAGFPSAKSDLSLKLRSLLFAHVIDLSRLLTLHAPDIEVWYSSEARVVQQATYDSIKKDCLCILNIVQVSSKHDRLQLENSG